MCFSASFDTFCKSNILKKKEQIPRISVAVFLNYGDDECLKMQVILVGHDIGGACISYAMEMNPRKVSRAVFVAATMLRNGQSALDVFSKQVKTIFRDLRSVSFYCFEAFFTDVKLHLQSGLTDLNQRAQKFIYGNGKKQQPTAMDYDKSLLEDFLFNRTPSKVR